MPADFRIPVSEATRDKVKSHLRGDESYDTYINALLDYLEGTIGELPWPRPPKATWGAMKAGSNTEVRSP